MVSVIIRVELKGSPGSDVYEDLHAFMEKKNWSRSIGGVRGKVTLPHAMYRGSTDNDLLQIATALKDSITTHIWTRAIVMVIRYDSWAIDGN